MELLKSFIAIVAIFLICLIVFVFVGAIETGINQDTSETSGALGFSGLLFFIISFFVLKKIWIKKASIENKPTEKEIEPKVAFVETLDFVVAGSDFNTISDVPREVYIEDLEPYDPLKFKAELNNEFDENAVLVFVDDIDIGYVPKKLSKKVKAYLQEEYELMGYVKKIYKKSGKVLCIAILEVSKKSS